MIVPAEKSAGQNSAYRHQIMKGASETERPSLYLLMSDESSFGRFFHLIDVLFDFLHRGMQSLRISRSSLESSSMLRACSCSSSNMMFCRCEM